MGRHGYRTEIRLVERTCDKVILLRYINRYRVCDLNPAKAGFFLPKIKLVIQC